MTSLMVAGAVRETPTQNRNSAILSKGAEHNKPLQPWRPRDGTGLTLTRLLDELRDALGAHGIDQASLDERLPTPAQIASRFNNKPQSELDDLLLAAKREFMDENKIIYDMLKPALIIDGIYEETDREEIRKYSTGIERDGRGLLRWALQWSDDRSLAKQGELRADLEKINFPNDCTVQQFKLGALGLFKTWKRIDGNDVQIPDLMYQRLLWAMPSTPPSLHIAQLRSRLAGQIADRVPLLFDDFTGGTAVIENLEAFAVSIGMSNGKSTSDDVLSYVGDDKPGNGKPPNNNKCNFCDS